MKPKLKKIVDTLNESESVELLEYVSEKVRGFNHGRGGPSIDFDRDPTESLEILFKALNGVLGRSDKVSGR